MKMRYMVIIFVVIFIGAGSFFIGKYSGKDTKEEKSVATEKVSDAHEKVSDIQSTKSNSDISDEKSEQTWEKLQELAKQEGVVAAEAKNNGSYNVKQPIRLSKNFYTILEKTNKITYIDGKAYVIIDVSLLNLSQEDYYSDTSNFILQDDSGYTYKADITYKTTGSINGNIQSGNGSKRGQIAFEVPYNRLNFILTFNTKNLPENTYKVQSINYKLNFPNK